MMRSIIIYTGLLLITAAIAMYVTGCLPGLTAADHRAIAADAVRISVCQDYGRECRRDASATGCFEVYSDCMDDAGLRQ